jgi:endonuclease G
LTGRNGWTWAGPASGGGPTPGWAKTSRPARGSTPATTSTAATWSAGPSRLGRDPGRGRPSQRRHLHYTNAAPQAATFNQGLGPWLGLETYLQDNAADNGRRLVVLTGPIFSDTDPAYRGVHIPLQFFKVAVFLHHGDLAATGYIVDQTPELANLPDVPRPGAIDEAPPLGPFRTFQVPVRDIAALTGLNLDQLVAADRMPISRALTTTPVISTWRRLNSPLDLDLDFDLNSTD